jgi:A/G-specific adenine glycosylase
VNLWDRAESLLPKRGIETYTQALMDLGATVCTRNPACEACPVRRGCVARKAGRIEELPAPRPGKPLPLRRATWHVFIHENRVLLERRPSPGIWGGLWCFPEMRNPAFRAASRRKLEPIDHGFTHFRLRIQPVLHHVKSAQRATGLWLDLVEAQAAAVPAPVRNLLRDLQRNYALSRR